MHNIKTSGGCVYLLTLLSFLKNHLSTSKALQIFSRSAGSRNDFCRNFALVASAKKLGMWLQQVGRSVSLVGYGHLPSTSTRCSWFALESWAWEVIAAGMPRSRSAHGCHIQQTTVAVRTAIIVIVVVCETAATITVISNCSCRYYCSNAFQNQILGGQKFGV